MTRQARAEVTREVIVVAAAKVFARMTFSQATLGDVLREGGVTQGALYFHFDSKRSLALEIIRRQHEIFAQQVQEEQDLNSGGISGMIGLSASLARLIASNNVVQAGLRLTTESAADLRSSGGDDAIITTPYKDWVDFAERFVREARNSGELHTKLSDAEVSRLIMSCFTGVQVVSRALTDWQDLLERLIDFWLVMAAALVVDRHRPSRDEITLILRERYL